MQTRFMQTGRLGLVAWMCWACGGAADDPDGDGWYDIPVAAPSPSARQSTPEPDLAEGAEGGPETDGPEMDNSAGAPSENVPSEPEPSRSALRGLTAAGELSEAGLFDALAQARAVCFGETHDNAAHHRAQARVATELVVRARGAGAPFALGFEMFQTPFQSVLTSFTLGSIDESELLQASEYATRWGYDFGFYRPLLELAREYRLPALALNAPAELTRKIAAQGLDGLSAEERASLPELDLNDQEHRAFITAQLGTFHSDEASLDNPYAVQVVWDETMAQTASDWLSSSGDAARVLIIAGLGHCHRSAVPSRITRRTGSAVLAVAPVLASRLGTPGFPTLEQYDVLAVIDD
jgi:uncharacterized iron-regulated protein